MEVALAMSNPKFLFFLSLLINNCFLVKIYFDLAPQKCIYEYKMYTFFTFSGVTDMIKFIDLII